MLVLYSLWNHVRAMTEHDNPVTSMFVSCPQYKLVLLYSSRYGFRSSRPG